MDSYLQIKNHDQNEGKVKSVNLSFKNNAILTTSEDGTIMVKKLDYNYLTEAGITSLREKRF